jgi:hypothetical protein
MGCDSYLPKWRVHELGILLFGTHKMSPMTRSILRKWVEDDNRDPDDDSDDDSDSDEIFDV